MESFRRRLPHFHPAGVPLFITWHLYGSLPHNLYPPPDTLNAGKAFVWMDRYLDTTRTGPMFLRQPAIARLVAESIRFGASKLRHYDLQAFAVMPNHVHLLALPLVSPSRFMQTLKGYTAREANRLLNRIGQPFWQAESYDHVVRNREEGDRIKEYVESNPVKAGLAACAGDYPWSSANPEWKVGAAETVDVGRNVEMTLDAADMKVQAT